jgi:Bacterial EndoU nuclease
MSFLSQLYSKQFFIRFLVCLSLFVFVVALQVFFDPQTNVNINKQPAPLKPIQELGVDTKEDITEPIEFTEAYSPFKNKTLVLPEYLSQQNFKHILEGNINRRGEATGYHRKESAPDDRTKIIRITNQPNTCGVYKAQVQVKDKLKQANSSMFPDRLSEEQVLEVLKQAYIDGVSKNQNNQNNQSFTVKTRDCFSVFMVLDDQKKIITSYPIY